MRHLTPVLTLASALLLGAGALSADDKADLTGFRDYRTVNGRPCDIFKLNESSFLLTDDASGVIYYVRRK